MCLESTATRRRSKTEESTGTLFRVGGGLRRTGHCHSESARPKPDARHHQGRRLNKRLFERFNVGETPLLQISPMKRERAERNLLIGSTGIARVFPTVVRVAPPVSPSAGLTITLTYRIEPTVRVATWYSRLLGIGGLRLGRWSRWRILYFSHVGASLV
jgi:hypothetical protein